MALFAQQVTLTGALQAINFFDTYQVRVGALGLLNLGSHPMQVRLGGAIPTNNALVLPPGAYMRIGSTGGIEELDFIGTASDDLQIFGTTEASDTLPDVVVFGGGGGGGSGAPADAKYLLFAGPVPGALTNAESAAALQSPLALILPVSGGPDNTPYHALFVNADFDTLTTQPGGGVGMKFAVNENTGAHEFGTLQFVKNADGAPNIDLQVLGYLGNALFTYEASRGGSPAGLLLKGGNDRRVATEGGNKLYLESGGSTVIVRSNGNDVVEFSNQHITAPTGKSLTIQTSASHDLTLINGGSNAGININDDATTPIQIITAGGGWGFRADGTLTAPNTTIKNLADGVDPQDAATVKQSTRLVTFSGQHLGNVNPGDAGTDVELLVGMAPKTGIDYGSSLGIESFAAPAGHLRKLLVNLLLNAQGALATLTFEVYKNGVATGVLVAFTLGASGVQATTATLALADGDLITLRMTQSGTGGGTGSIARCYVEIGA